MPRRLAIEIGIVAAAALLALAARLWLIGIYLIPSESMLPTLLPGDYVLVEKWRAPGRGDVIVFHAPPTGRHDYVKRLIGLPGDRVALRGGVLVLNGRAVPRRRLADVIAPCLPPGRACRYRRYRETLPGGRSYDVLDLGPGAGDAFGPVTVPRGRLFLLGDNRDLSADSRFPARDGGAIGMVPVAAIVGRGGVTLVSIGRGAIRWGRTGTRF